MRRFLFRTPFRFLVAFVNPLGPEGSLLGVVCNVLDWVFYFSIPVGLVAIIYAAFLFLTSGGDRGKVTNARNALLAAVLGWTVLFLVTLLPRIVAQLLGVTDLPDAC